VDQAIGSFGVSFTSPQVILFSADVQRASEFYRRLGFQETFRFPAAGTPIHANLELGGYRIGFASTASTRDDHGLQPAEEGQRQRSRSGPTTPLRRTARS
jgi:glyoxylase I family protein